jgi:HSP20 family molecular chaperone IbpA
MPSRLKRKAELSVQKVAPEWSPNVDIRPTEDKLTFCVHLPLVRLKDIHAQIEGQTLTIEGLRHVRNPDKPPEIIVPDGVDQFVPQLVRPVFDTQHFSTTLTLPSEIDVQSREAYFKDEVLTIAFWKTTPKAKTIREGEQSHDELLARLGVRRPSNGDPFPVDLITPEAAIIRAPKKSLAGEVMVIEDDRIITKNGMRYFPLSLAASLALAPRTTLLDWIKAKRRFGGRKLEAYNSPTAGKMYLNEDSIERVANRFIKWPSKKAAGTVILGTTEDQNGYLALQEAMRILGVSKRTMFLWATKGKAPVEHQPDVIRCPVTKHFYIREKDVYELKAALPPSGLSRGRRPRALQS